jgi:hypothetical protein
LLGMSTQEQEGRREGRKDPAAQTTSKGKGKGWIDGPVSLGQCQWSVSMVNASHNKEGKGTRATEQRSGGAP